MRSKQFMAWVIDSNKFKILSKQKQENSISPQFQTLRWRLLGSYLLVTFAIWSIGDVVVYKFFASSLDREVDSRLLNLAQAAAHSLLAIERDPKAVDRTIYPPLDRDGDLDIPWQHLRSQQQNVEWFNAEKKTLATSGQFFPDIPLKIGFQTLRERNLKPKLKLSNIRTLTIPAYFEIQQKQQLIGYIRVIESTESLELTLTRLLWGLYLGGTLALLLMGFGGIWLTRQSLKPIEQSYQQLKQFTADASHELRSPLTVIKTSVEVMQTHPERIDPADVDKLTAIISATNQMSRLVEDLLFLARNDAAEVKASQPFRKIPLDELLEDLLELFELKAEAKNISLQYACQKANFHLAGNISQLQRLFSNLLDNALQYTPSAGTVTISLKKIDNFAVVSIEDTGLGIAPENLPLIFDRFWRAEGARSCRQEGSGLGLAIAQAIVQRHGGEISVDSKLGVGSCFKIRLPLNA